MFERLKRMIQDASAKTGRVYKSVFDLPNVPAFNQFYEYGIFPWKALYRGFYSPWHLIPAPTIKDEKATRRMHYLNLSKAVCSELAGMVWTDQADVHVSTQDGAEDLEDFVQHVFKDNAFQTKLREAVEQAAAMGGEAMKVWYDAKHDEDGNEIAGTGRIKIGYCMADQFIPTAWDNAEVTEGIFVSRIAKDGYYYTRLEWHQWNGETYVVKNDLYKAEMRKGDGTQDILGYAYPLSLMYPQIAPYTEIPVGKSLFAYFRTPEANNLDDNSPLGVSIYANAMETLHALDICFDSFVREFSLGKKRIIVPARAVKQVADPVTGKMTRFFDANDEVYEALSTDDVDGLKIQDNSVELRVEEHVAAMNAFLNIFCLQVGLSFGTFSFDVSTGLKTATEIVSENSKTYKTVKGFQNCVIPAIERTVENILAVAALYDVEWNGRKVADLARNGYSVSVTLDDGVVQDRQTNINEGLTLVAAGLMSKRTFLTDKKYGQALTDEEAEKELQRIADESRITLPTLDVMDYNGAE